MRALLVGYVWAALETGDLTWIKSRDDESALGCNSCLQFAF